jgi:hypothetical protein
VITLPDPVNSVIFSADSRDVVTMDNAGVLREYDACTDCENPAALLVLARSRVTRALTAKERQEFGVG